jgi:hypothetical protein
LPTYTATDRTLAAPLVVEGTAIAVGGDVFGQTAVVEVARYLKGIGPQYIAITGYGPSSVCLAEVSQYFTGVFYVSGDETTGYRAFYLSQFDSLAPNDEATLSEIIAASGQEPRTDFTPAQVGTPDAVMTQAMATQVGALLTATPPAFAPPPFVITASPFIPTPPVPTSSSAYVFTSLYALGLLALGGAIGLMVGLLLGLLIGRRR